MKKKIKELVEIVIKSVNYFENPNIDDQPRDERGRWTMGGYSEDEIRENIQAAYIRAGGLGHENGVAISEISKDIEGEMPGITPEKIGPVLFKMQHEGNAILWQHTDPQLLTPEVIKWAITNDPSADRKKPWAGIWKHTIYFPKLGKD